MRQVYSSPSYYWKHCCKINIRWYDLQSNTICAYRTLGWEKMRETVVRTNHVLVLDHSIAMRYEMVRVCIKNCCIANVLVCFQYEKDESLAVDKFFPR